MSARASAAISRASCSLSPWVMPKSKSGKVTTNPPSSAGSKRAWQFIRGRCPIAQDALKSSFLDFLRVARHLGFLVAEEDPSVLGPLLESAPGLRQFPPQLTRRLDEGRGPGDGCRGGVRHRT